MESENELMAIRGRLVEGIDWEFGIHMYTLLYLKQVINTDLSLSSQGSGSNPGLLRCMQILYH